MGGYLHISSNSVKEERYQVWTSVKERDRYFFSHCIVFPIMFLKWILCNHTVCGSC